VSGAHAFIRRHQHEAHAQAVSVGISVSTIDGASAAPAEAAVKIATPIASSRRRPKRSPSAGPVISSSANVSK
jgi:hypothetical protein